jgi:hypothetical protein
MPDLPSSPLPPHLQEIVRSVSRLPPCRNCDSIIQPTPQGQIVGDMLMGKSEHKYPSLHGTIAKNLT